MLGDQSIVLLSWGPSGEFVDRVGEKLELKFKKAKEKGLDFGKVERIHIKDRFFCDGEINLPPLGKSMRGKDIYVVQCIRYGDPGLLHIDIVALLVVLDALKRARPTRITVYISCFPYARQHRKFEGREPITAKLMFNLIESAAGSRFYGHGVVELHDKTCEGFSEYPIDYITTEHLVMSWAICFLSLDDLVVACPDVGRVKQAEDIIIRLDCGLAVVHKVHGKGEAAKAKFSLGDVEGKKVLLIDDIIDTANTLVEAADSLIEKGAKEIYAAAPHGMFSKNEDGISGLERLEDSVIKKILITDSIPRSLEFYKKHPKLVVLTITNLIADGILCNHTNLSFKDILDGNLAQATTGELEIKDYIISG